MTAAPDGYGEYVARTGLVVAFEVPDLQRVDPNIIRVPPGWTIDPETGRGMPAANEYPFGSFKAWTLALEMNNP